jgi:hypothetical protein
MDGWGICDTFYIQWFVNFYFSNLYLDLLEFEINYNYNYIMRNLIPITCTVCQYCCIEKIKDKMHRTCSTTEKNFGQKPLKRDIKNRQVQIMG